MNLQVSQVSDKEVVSFQQTVIKVEIRITREGGGEDEVEVDVNPSVYQEVDVSEGEQGWMKVDCGVGEVIDLTGDGAKFVTEGLKEVGGAPGFEEMVGMKNGRGITAGIEDDAKQKLEKEDEASRSDQKTSKEENMEMDDGTMAEFGGALEGEDADSPLLDEALVTLPEEETIRRMRRAYMEMDG